MLVIDSEKNILFTNPFFKDSFLMRGSAYGQKVSDILGDNSVLDAIDKTLRSKDATPGKVIMEGQNGNVLEVRLVHFVEETIRGLIGFFRDITEEKRVEAIKRDFVANVSHELRTPLASIKGYAETLLDGAMKDSDILDKFLSIIDKHANRMTALIDDLLILSKLESQQMPLNLEEVDIQGLIQGVIHSLEKNARDKGLKLVGNIQKDIPKIMSDKVRLEQVIVNLIDNAVKYTNHGEVRLNAFIDGETLRVDVEDTGTGIPEKDLARIFERFYRVDKGRSRDLGGTGLGLAIVKHIIQAHNGKIWVHSLPGKGTTFSFSIPF